MPPKAQTPQAVSPQTSSSKRRKRQGRRASCLSVCALVFAVLIGLLAIPYNKIVEVNELRDPSIYNDIGNGCCCSEVHLRSTGDPAEDLKPLMIHQNNRTQEQMDELRLLSLVKNELTDPYFVSTAALVDSTKFMLVRGLMYFVALVHGVLTSLPFILKPAEVMLDSEVSALFESQWPFCSLLHRNESALSDGKDYYFDGRAMGHLQPLPGYYTAGTYARFRLGDNNKLTLVSITVNDKDVMTPSDTDAWRLAKFYVLQGAHYLVKFGQHPHIHFNWDAMIAITHHWLPEDHVISQLLAPHFEFIRNIDKMVLMGHSTVLNSGKEGAPWFANIHTCSREQITKMIRYGQTKINFTRKPLCQALEPWYKAIRNFVHTVLIEQRLAIDERVQRWAKSINIILEYGLPEGEALDVQDIEDVIVDGIYRISVQHSADHYGFLQVSTRKLPMVTRIAWSHDATIGGDFQLQTPWDGFKEHIYEQMFVKWWDNPFQSTALVSAKYDFGADNNKPELIEAVKIFRKELQHASDTTFLPLNAVSKAIEW